MHLHDRTQPPPPAKAHHLRPEFLRVDDAIRIFGIKKTKLYEWLGSGQIKSVSIRERGAARGVRLIDYESLLEFINKFDDGFEQS